MASRRSYYPGFFGALFLVLLRIAIGWHFANEGKEKLESWSKGDKSFTAEYYLRASTGPLSPRFHALVPDVNGLDRLIPDRLKAGWEADVDRIAVHYGFDDTQRGAAKSILNESEAYANAWFGDREMKEKTGHYFVDLRGVQKAEGNYWGALSYERERAVEKRKELDKTRVELVRDLDARGALLRDTVVKLATKEQSGSAGPYVPPPSSLVQMNVFISVVLAAIGVCLMAGFLTRFAALGGALFLLQIYLSMPPWPGLPVSPKAEGHYFLVDKNLVEMFACFALAFLPTGQWVGLDALFFGRRRRVEAELAERSAHEHASGGRRTHSVS